LPSLARSLPLTSLRFSRGQPLSYLGAKTERMKKRARQYRQGDVLLTGIDPPVKPGKPIDSINGKLVLASGELTGHSHTVPALDGKAEVFQGPRHLRYLHLAAAGQLQHQEHGAIDLEAGWYEVRAQREYDPAQTVPTNAND
jgi:hypothetical protein